MSHELVGLKVRCKKNYTHRIKEGDVYTIRSVRRRTHMDLGEYADGYIEYKATFVETSPQTQHYNLKNFELLSEEEADMIDGEHKKGRSMSQNSKKPCFVQQVTVSAIPNEEDEKNGVPTLEPIGDVNFFATGAEANAYVEAQIYEGMNAKEDRRYAVYPLGAIMQAEKPPIKTSLI